MNGETKRQFKHSTLKILDSTYEYGKGAIKYSSAAVLGAGTGAVIGGATGIAVGSTVTAATCGADLGITPATMGVSFALTGAGIGSTIGLKLVEESASKNVENASRKYREGLRGMKSAIKHTRTYTRVSTGVHNFFHNRNAANDEIVVLSAQANKI